MPGLIIWKNQEFNKLRRDMDRMFDRFMGEFGLSSFTRPLRAFPVIDITETDKNVVVRADVPGINPDDIDIAITENSLSIKGEIRRERIGDNEGFVVAERSYQSFSRRLHLPCRVRVDDVKATYDGGVLNIIMPKYEEKIPRAIKVEK